MTVFNIQASKLQLSFHAPHHARLSTSQFVWESNDMVKMAELFKEILLEGANPEQGQYPKTLHPAAECLSSYTPDQIWNVYTNNRIPPAAKGAERIFWAQMGFKQFGWYQEILDDLPEQGDIHLDNGVYIATAEHLNQINEGERVYPPDSIWLYTNNGYEQQITCYYDLLLADCNHAWVTDFETS